MPSDAHNAALNELLITLRRSLLQYVGECWPWVPTDADDEQTPIRELVAVQDRSVARLVALLDVRYWPIDFGVYPAEYTDLHYIGLDYLLTQLVKSETAVLNELAWVGTACLHDLDARPLLEGVAADQREIVARLNKLVQACQGGDLVAG